MTGELSAGEDLEISSVIPTGHIPGAKLQKSVRITDVSADIPIEHLPNTSVGHYQ
jgi:hypothetical protein